MINSKKEEQIVPSIRKLMENGIESFILLYSIEDENILKNDVNLFELENFSDVVVNIDKVWMISADYNQKRREIEKMAMKVQKMSRNKLKIGEQIILCDKF